jgi:hypothetical protein
VCFRLKPFSGQVPSGPLRNKYVYIAEALSRPRVRLALPEANDEMEIPNSFIALACEFRSFSR